jgi:protein tyrosine/serine phosphatase
MKTNFSRFFVAFLALALIFAVTASAQTAPANFPNINIKNFGQMDDRFYRGAQPLQGDYQSLKDLGIKTVIDLRDDPTDYEKSAVETLGMKYVNIPMSGWRSPKDNQIKEFLDLVKNPETGIFFVHCKAGIHRTGVAGAVYRYTKYNWDYDQVYREMKNYNFSSGLVHGALKSFVKEYARNFHAESAGASAVRNASTDLSLSPRK